MFVYGKKGYFKKISLNDNEIFSVCIYSVGGRDRCLLDS